MHDENPYQAPQSDIAMGDVPAAGGAASSRVRDPIAELTDDTVVPRYIAASLDMFLMLILAVVAAKQFSNEQPLLQTAVAIAVYPAYFLLWEGLTARSPGKLLTGLVIVGFDGRRCSWKQTILRTFFRMFEVNPVLFGAIPAALFIVTSPRRQRIGDKVAGTIVVPARRLKKPQRSK